MSELTLLDLMEMEVAPAMLEPEVGEIEPATPMESEPQVNVERATTYEQIRYWVEERERIRLKKEAGLPSPWTQDPILRTWKFCNVARADDRVSRWIRQHIIVPYREHPNLWLMLAICRWVNWPPTLTELITEGAWPTGEPDWAHMVAVIEARAARGEKAWGAAYMQHAENDRTAKYHRTGKPREVLLGYLAEGLWPKRNAILRALETRKQSPVHRVLVGCHGWGSFMAGQVVADLTWTPLLKDATDLYTWAPLGPGSQRGLNRLAGRRIDTPLTESVAIAEMIALRERLIRDVPWTERLTLMDVQNVCCETDKFLRVFHGEGTPRSKYKPETAY